MKGIGSEQKTLSTAEFLFSINIYITNLDR